MTKSIFLCSNICKAFILIYVSHYLRHLPAHEYIDREEQAFIEEAEEMNHSDIYFCTLDFFFPFVI